MTAAASSSTGKVFAEASSSRPVSVKPMPNASAYGIGRRSAYKPTSGWSNEAVTW
jgi:hypothetical protein